MISIFSFFLLLLLLAGGIWLVNLIWFRPFSIDRFYDRFVLKWLLDDPEAVTLLGIPVLSYFSSHKLTDQSEAKLKRIRARKENQLKTLRAYKRTRQNESQLLSTDILQWHLDNEVRGNRFPHHNYPVNQTLGVQGELPTFMETFHTIRSKKDARDYIKRLSKFGIKFDQVLEGLKIREAKNIILPKFAVKNVLEEMKGFISRPARENILYTSFSQKLDKVAGLAGVKNSLLTECGKQIEETVYPAYRKLIEYFEDLYQKATAEDGVWKFPDGEAFYQYILRSHITIDLLPEDVHRLGLAEVERIEGEIRELFRQTSYNDETKTIGQLMRDLEAVERFHFSGDSQGQKEFLARFTEIIKAMEKELPKMFEVLPEAAVEVRRIPEFKEKTAPAALYYEPAMDKSRPGVFFVNVHYAGTTSTFSMPTLAYHEAVPGHHLQVAIQQEAKTTPLFRKLILFNAYTEGWALYAEKLAAEYGLYKEDVYGNLGRLQAEMWRAVRLVVDTGLHYKRWSREQAIGYMESKTGYGHQETVSEVERYIVLPGQACSYKIGELKILELREKAKKALGDKFNIKEFHKVILGGGSMPLEILKKQVDKYIRSRTEKQKS